MLLLERISNPDSSGSISTSTGTRGSSSIVTHHTTLHKLEVMSYLEAPEYDSIRICHHSSV